MVKDDIMNIIHIPLKYKKTVTLPEEILKEIKGKTLALYTSVQFIDSIPEIKKQLTKKKINVITSKPKRAYYESQILGCDCFPDSLNLKDEDKEQIELYLYIGDGFFHPYALLYSQKDQNPKPVLIYNPISESYKTITRNEIGKNIKKHKSNLSKLLMSNNIGIFITTKHGQYQKNIALKIKEMLEKRNKKAYLFIGDLFSDKEAENFPFIDVWINTACPRIGYDDIVNMKFPVVNANDAIKILK